MSLDNLIDTQRAWLTGAFAKVCFRFDSEAELMQILNKAWEAGLEVPLITDSGRTRFHGQPTRSCLAIGPDEADKIDQISGHLQLLQSPSTVWRSDRSCCRIWGSSALG